ncbi:FMN-linked oxidoreductase [Rickenella mellea]|uniref:FMN-linked oxidoreductase n=1 Tax=Rickenella mellea TaxID=50990 RepID=A0A4Y7PY01_9AGAM|nr:FMN-linked oxidoreductase [Rickenella mellea]
MSRHPTPPLSPRPVKRQKVDHLTSEDFKNGIMLAPMVRSGSLPTRLFALKHGASLVWSPEIVDKAILHSERVVDPNTGVVSYNGKSGPMFMTHPIEKPYLIYQIGSANPDLAVQAAKTMQQDVSGIDLNCGCPKPFSTHAGMGAALLTNPDLLCSILTALREAMPPEITVTAKIRLLQSQEDTLKLVERIVNTGVAAITIHCRTRNMRPRERALIERLREIVHFVEGLGKGIAVIENGDCVGLNDVVRMRGITGAHSFMVATAAESNPTCFSRTPLVDLEQSLIPHYIRLGSYLGNIWPSTKFCAMSFKGSHKSLSKADRKDVRDILSHAKSYVDVDGLLGGVWNGAEEMQAIVSAIEARSRWTGRVLDDIISQPVDDPARSEPLERNADQEEKVNPGLVTPPEKRENPEMITLATPRQPPNERMVPIPAMISGRDAPTPTPTPGPGGVLRHAP